MEDANVARLIESGLAPFRAALERIDSQIAEHEAAIKPLREDRRRVKSILGAAEAKKPGPPKKRGEPSRSRTPEVAQDKQDALTTYLRAHFNNGQPFTVGDVFKREDFELMSEPHLRMSFNALHDRGILALDHVDERGRRRSWKLLA